MSNITQEKKVVDGNKEEYYRSLLQEVKRYCVKIQRKINIFYNFTHVKEDN